MRAVVHESGFVGLFKGNLANVVRVIPNYALKVFDLYVASFRGVGGPVAYLSVASSLSTIGSKR